MRSNKSYTCDNSTQGRGEVNACANTILCPAISFKHNTWLFQEWILQNKARNLMMLTQRSILNRDSTDVDKNNARELNRTPFRQRKSVLRV